MPKNLPIQFVEVRGVRDVFLKEGGGGSEVPKWVTVETITHNVDSMRHAFQIMNGQFAERNENSKETLPLLAVATLHEKATAKSYRPNVRSIFDEKRTRNIIGAGSTGSLLVKIDDEEALKRMAMNYTDKSVAVASKVRKFGLAAVTGLQPFHPYIEENILGHRLKVRLVDYLDSRLNEKAETMFIGLCRDYGLQAKKVNYGQDLRIYSLNKTNDKAALHALGTMDAVISVKRMPYIELSISPNLNNTTIKVKSPKEGEDYPLVGLLDSGIDNIPHLTPWMQGKNQNIAGFDKSDIDLRHGTAVAGIFNYGDELEDHQWTGCSPMKIVSCIVNTDPDSAIVEEYEMIEYIRTAVATNPDVRVWNLSQGSTLPVSGDFFSDFAIALDSIQKEYNVLFCKSAGNYKWEEDSNCRITQGADSVLSLVVGSIADRFEQDGDVQPGQRSPFSRKGPGPEFIIKPDLVHYGGNAHASVQSFSITGYQCKGLYGTSFSTPRVSSLASNLVHRISKGFDATLIKALLIHHASYKNTENIDNADLLCEQGYGLPSDLNEMLNNDADEFTMIWQPQLDQGDAQIQDIPFPKSMVGDDGFFYGDITVTVVSDPVLKAAEGSEYCQSDVEVLLQTYGGIRYQPLNAMGGSRYYRNSERLIEPQNILAKNLYSKKSWRSADWEERTLIESEFKYQPVKKYHVNLDMMQPAKRRAYLSNDRHWCLSVKAKYRDSVATDMEYDGTFVNTRATIIITIRDQRHKGVAYKECYASLEEHYFNHSNLAIQQHIQVESQG